LEAGSLTIGGGYHDPGYGQNAPALGELNIDGGSVNSGAVSMGDTALGDGFASVRNGDWRINGGDLLVGNQGIGLVEIGGGGTVDTTGNVVQIAAAGGSQGQVEVLAGGTLEAGDLIIGGGYLDPGYGQNAPAVGNLIIDGGTVNSGGVSMGETALGDGFASVRNGDWRINGGSLQVGYEGIGQIEIGDGGTVDTNGNGMQIAAVGGSQGQVDVLNGGMLHAGGLIIGGGDGVGPDAFGSLNIDGGVVNSTSANVGNLFNGVGDVSIDNGTWNAGANVNFGHQGIGDARIGAGGVLNSQFINIGRESTGIGEVDVDGGTINLTGDGGNGGFANVGRFGDGTLRVRNGGWVNLTAVGVDFPGINIGREAGSTGLVEVTGTTSRITIDGDQPGLFQAGLIQVGRGGDGTLKVLDGGQVLNDPDGIVVLGARSGATGSLLVDGTGALLDAGNTLQIGRFDGTSLGVAQVSDGGVIRALTVEVNANGLLMGDGTVIGNVDNVGGTVAMGNSPGLLTVQGDYSQSAAGTMEVELAGFVFDPGNGVVEYDVLDVMGDVFLDGVLDLLVETNFMALLHVGDVFEVIRGQSISGAFANILNADLGSGRFFRAVYNATSVHLVVAAVPAPGGIALFGLALAVLAVRRRRRA
ncbi:MAG: PEP-CTERM sorting domain-containing protein, partial [Alphaproteobacteria bacterium]|nr:PEP-CTERM sorting domain-containing protein [Alphaproteobacteria bacterium]